MDVVQTREFERDIKKANAKTRQRVDEAVRSLANAEKIGNELHHMKNVYAIRIENKRLVYQALDKENKIILLLFKSREDVYEYLKG